MNPTTPDIYEQFAAHATDMIMPWIAVLLSVIAALWLKDFASNLLAGMSFKYTSPFKEGDHVILDDEAAMIIKVGVRDTVFGRYTENGYTWRYVPNDRIHMVKIEKLVRQDLHLDTDIEKGQRIIELALKAQDAYSNPSMGDKIKETTPGTTHVTKVSGNVGQGIRQED